MLIGTQLHAPRGFEALAGGIIYHYLHSDPTRNRVTLVTFNASIQTAEAGAPRPSLKVMSPMLVYLNRVRFEEGIHSELITLCESPRSLPPWFGDITITDLLTHDQRDHKRERSHESRIDSLLVHLWPAVTDSLRILTSDHPCLELNRVARDCKPKQNETRFRIAFFAYICFGMERLALHYPIANIGHWDRTSKTKKLGRPSSLGQWHGHSACSDSIQQKCEEGFRKFSKLGVSMKSIYRDTMRHIFGCTVQTDRQMNKWFSHPEGKPFPTEGQFAYHVSKRFDLSIRQTLKYGDAGVRSKLSPSKGKFTDAVANLMEVIEEDGYWIEEVAQGFIEGSSLPRMIVIRIHCVASGMIVGIGFSIKGERAEAYRNAKACMAVDKVWFCSLYGVRISAEDWPSIGLPLDEIADRGPGSTSGADSADDYLKSIIKETAPANSGQSKAGIETKHPKSVKLEGAPHYKVTSLTIPQLAAREIRRLIATNQTTDISSRLSVDAIAAGVLPTPLNYWNYLSKIGRTFAYGTTREQAVRAFFTRVDLTILDGSIFFYGFRYWSKALENCQAIQQAHGRATQIQGFMLETCIRHILLDTTEGLITVDLKIGIRSGDEEHFLSVVEIEQLARLRDLSRTAFKIHSQAAQAEAAQKFEEEIGAPHDEVEIRRGRAKRGNAASVDEAREITPYLRLGRRTK